MINARKAACNALLTVDSENAYSNITLDDVLKNSEMSGGDKALASMLFYGVLERRITIDTVIERLSGRSMKKISPLTAEALRIGIYQLLFTDKIPQSAAVNESVNIIKYSKKERYAAGFVNGVLRNAARKSEELKKEISESSDFSFRFSCDKSICQSLINDYGREAAESFLSRSLLPSSTYLRVNTCKTDAKALTAMLEKKGILCRSTPISDALVAKKLNGISELSEYRDGFFHVQDLSSQICSAALDTAPGQRVLDACAAPGGKSFTVAEIMENCGEVVSCDIHEHRVKLIKNGASRLGLSIIKAISADATDDNGDFGEFDRILCDVPCSGFGVVGRKPEIKYKKTDDFEELPLLQKKILAQSAKHLKSGGRLVYSTCTLRKAENDEIINDFLNTNPMFSIEAPDVYGLCEKRPYTLFPQDDETDGFFLAVLVKS